MESLKLINELQNVIRQNLFYAYQKNTAKNTFENVSNLEFVNQKFIFKTFKYDLGYFM